MALRSCEDWETFFIALKDIPVEEGKKYANLFATNRMTEKSLKTLEKQDLRDIGITLIGDIKTIMQHVQSEYKEQQGYSSKSIKVNLQDLPKVKETMTRVEFNKFKSDWNNCKIMMI